jgi:hypothetical protein
VFRSVRERPTSEAGLLRAFDGRIGTVTLEELDPKARLRDAVARIADNPIAHVSDLLPWNWTSHAEHPTASEAA